MSLWLNNCAYTINKVVSYIVSAQENISFTILRLTNAIRIDIIEVRLGYAHSPPTNFPIFDSELIAQKLRSITNIYNFKTTYEMRKIHLLQNSNQL